MAESDIHGDDVVALHQALVDKLKGIGCITTAPVEAAFRAIPRHLFLPGVALDIVYSDEAIPTKRLDNGQVISSSSQPAIMAIMLEQLGLEPGMRVLEIGAGTGYNAALLATIVGETGQVVAVDIDEDIVANARAHLATAGLDRVQVICGDGGFGYPTAAPYDRIILTVGAWDIAPAWQEQLQPAGRILLPMSLNGPQMSVAFALADGHLASVSVAACGFMRLRGAFAGPETRVQLGPEPGLALNFADQRDVDAAAIYASLTGPSWDRATGIVATLHEVLGGLSLWLAVREPGLCSLGAEGAPAESGVVPYLFGRAGHQTVRFTNGLLDQTSLCVLMRSQSLPPALDTPDTPVAFELLVRSFGPQDALAQRLIDQLAAWDAAGRPATLGLSIRAYPSDIDYSPLANEVVIPKRWTTLVVRWEAADDNGRDSEDAGLLRR
jgi:protein-L-isoaspartate(D-aspartate) O-methyltransferase